MSGRLVILRHKKWNVWNQDNQEKVLKDERLAREEEQEKFEKERKRTQEKNLEILNGVVVSDEPLITAEKLKKTNEKKPDLSNKEPPPQKFSELTANKPWYMTSALPNQSGDTKKDDDNEDPMHKFMQDKDTEKLSRPYADLPPPSVLTIDDLRAKRLKREKQEKKRAALLLANNEIYGDNNKRKKI